MGKKQCLFLLLDIVRAEGGQNQKTWIRIACNLTQDVDYYQRLTCKDKLSETKEINFKS